MKYVKSLKFDDEPDYAYIKGELKRAFDKNSYVYDDRFDWVNYGILQEKTSAFLFLSRKQQEFNKAGLRPRKISNDGYNKKSIGLKSSKLLNTGKVEKGILQTNRNSHVATFSHKDSQEKSNENVIGERSHKQIVPLTTSNEEIVNVNEKKLKKDTVKCTCLIL